MSTGGTGRGRRRRRSVRVSEVDRRLMEQGLPPSWQERVSAEDLGAGAAGDDDPDGASDRGDGANDARLRDNVPPHSQPRS